MADELITKTAANLCAALAQHGNGITGDFLSAYWSAVEGQSIPLVFIQQARSRIGTVVELLDILEGKRKAR